VPFKAKAVSRHHIPKQARRVTNWAAYDASLRQRGSLTVWFSEDAIAGWRAEGRTTPGGQPHYSALAILTGLCLRAVFRLALRQTEGLIGSIIGLLGLDLAIPDHTTLCRRADGLDVPRPQSSPGAGGMHLIVDSTGLKFHGPGEWLVEKHGTRTRRSWRTLHIGLDADTGRIVAAELTTNEVDDGSQVGPLLDQVAGAVASFTADGAYDTGAVSAAVAGRHPDAAIIVPPRATSHEPLPCRATPPKPIRRNATATYKVSPTMAVPVDRNPPATTSDRGSRLRSAGSSRSSATVCIPRPMPARMPRSPSPSTYSTGCWTLGARPPSASCEAQ